MLIMSTIIANSRLRQPHTLSMSSFCLPTCHASEWPRQSISCHSQTRSSLSHTICCALMPLSSSMATQSLPMSAKSLITSWLVFLFINKFQLIYSCIDFYYVWGLILQAQYLIVLCSFKEQLQQHVRVHAVEAVMACREIESNLQAFTGICSISSEKNFTFLTVDFNNFISYFYYIPYTIFRV